MLYTKALHIIFIVTWFAGLFYIVRLFIYHSEAEEKEELERNILRKQFVKMEKLLWNVITVPSMVLALLSGTYLAYLTKYYLTDWFWVKMGLVLGLLLYHFSCGYIAKLFAKGDIKYTSYQLRLWNEVATLFLVSIVFIVVLKNTMSLLWGVIGLVLFGMLMLLIVKVYKRFREKNQ